MTMQANLRTWLVILVALPLALPGSSWAEGTYSGGTGEPNDPYLISTAADMNEIGTHTEDWDDCFLLIADIDLIDYNETNFNIIGNTSTGFTGVFDGNGHTVTDFTYSSTRIQYIGLFGYVDGPNAEIKNLGLINSSIINAGIGTSIYLGSLVGMLKDGTVTDCNSVGGSVLGTNADSVGGLVGENYGTVSNSFATSTVLGSHEVGGLVGINYGTVSNSYAAGNVSGSYQVGGVVGKNYGTVSNSYYTTGIVSGNGTVGGLVGWNIGGVVSNSYSTSLVIGDDTVGGLVGLNYGTVSTSYATGIVSGNGIVGGLVGRNGGMVSTSYATGSVSGTEDRVGGLAGVNWGGDVSNSYATGGVVGNQDVGGLVGHNWDGMVSNCYSAGDVNGITDVGGLVGGSGGHVVSSYWDTQTSGQGSSVGGTGKMTDEMKDPNTYVSWGWCGPVWTIDANNDYPRLAWENASGEIIDNPKPSYMGGTGEPNNPYLIETAEQLNSIGLIVCDWDKYFKLTADIDLGGYTGTAFNIIGNPFTGVFDGNGHTVSNFTYNSTGIDFIGLFGYIDDPNAEIKNLRLIDSNVDAGTGVYVGSLVGVLKDGTVTNCNSRGGSVSGDWYVGGLLGWNRNYGTVSNSYATCSVSGNDYIGGLVGYNDRGTVNISHATGLVMGGDGIGGLVGSNEFGTVSNSYAQGNVDGNDYVGGLVGVNASYGDVYYSTVSNSYSSGDVTGVTYIGGLVGYESYFLESYNEYIKSFWDNTVNPDINGIGNWSDPDVMGESTENMQTASTFINAGWDFVGETTNGTEDIWIIDEGVNYPRFTLEFDCNGNGVFDHLDIINGTSDDINSNGIPDECEPDCNGNGIPDGYDISTGTSQDCNGNGVPDECDISSGTSNDINGNGVPDECEPDCNGNGIPDDYDISTGTSQDCNGNGIPDECDISSGYSADVDCNGIPDECQPNGGGSGEPNDPYLIYTAVHMNQIGTDPNNWDKHFKLMADPNMVDGNGTPFNFNIIGNPEIPFTGFFDGNNRRILNLTYTSTNSNYVGLFGYVGSGGEIKNLELEKASIDITGYGSYMGTLAGLNRGRISNCCSTGSITGGFSYVGGLCGYNEGGIISRCCFEGDIESETFSHNVGGLVGGSSCLWLSDDYFLVPYIERSYMSGSVTGGTSVGGLVGQSAVSCTIMSFSDANTAGAQDIGGLIGYHYGHVAVANCYSIGSVKGETNIGGLIGYSSALNNDAGINNCYTTCYVQGNNSAGGLMGYAEYDNICHNSFWDVNTSGLTVSDGGEGKTTLEMQDPDTFINAGWDFDKPIWMICGQDYPKLIWNYPDIDGSGRVNFADFAEIAARWMSFDCGMCGGVDLTGDRDINMDDLFVFVGSWLDVYDISDYVFEIEIKTAWDYEDPNDSNDTEYEFELYMTTDDRVESIEFFAPSGSTYEIPKIPWQRFDIPGGYTETECEYDFEEGIYEWTYYTSFYEPNGLAAFGDGQYIITVYYDNNRQDQTTVWFGVPDSNDFIPQPIQEPVPIFPAPGATDVISPVTFTWQPCTDPNAINIWIYAESDVTDEEIEPDTPLPAGATNWGPKDLSEGLWESGLIFANWHSTQNSDGINVWVVKYSESDYTFTVVP